MNGPSITDFTPTNHTNACICLIDIVRFSKWCSEHSPVEIFETMTQYNLFLSNMIEKYTDIDKVEMVGDSVLIMGGFRNKECISHNVHNMLHFAIELIENVDKIRELFSDDNSIRVGVHTGDIYSGFILNPTKFQLFGNSINVASRLESISLPGTFRVSECAFSHLKDHHRTPIIMDVVGKPTTSILKGVGSVENRLGCVLMNKYLIADDDVTTNEILVRICERRLNVKTKSTWTVVQTFSALKENKYDVCMLDVCMDMDVLEYLHEFRRWENTYRVNKQHIVLMTTVADDKHYVTLHENYNDLVDGFLDKNNMYQMSFQTFDMNSFNQFRIKPKSKIKLTNSV